MDVVGLALEQTFVVALLPTINIGQAVGLRAQFLLRTPSSQLATAALLLPLPLLPLLLLLQELLEPPPDIGIVVRQAAVGQGRHLLVTLLEIVPRMVSLSLIPMVRACAIMDLLTCATTTNRLQSRQHWHTDLRLPQLLVDRKALGAVPVMN